MNLDKTINFIQCEIYRFIENKNKNPDYIVISQKLFDDLEGMNRKYTIANKRSIAVIMGIQVFIDERLKDHMFKVVGEL